MEEAKERREGMEKRKAAEEERRGIPRCKGGSVRCVADGGAGAVVPSVGV